MEAAPSQLDLHSGAPFATLVRDLAAAKNGGDRILNDIVLFDVYFTEEMDCFAFRGTAMGQNPVYYIGSASGNYTTQEIIAYFNGLVPGM